MDAITTGLACIAFLALAALAVVRARRDPLASRFAAMCVVLFTYNAFQLLKDLSGDTLWDWFNNAAGAMCTPVYYHFTMAFLGQRRVRRPSTAIFYTYFGAIAVASLLPVVVPSFAWFSAPSPLYGVLMLVGLVPAVGSGSVRLVVYARRQLAEERARTALLLAAVLVAAGGASADLFAIAGSGQFRPAAFSLVASACLLGITAIRTRVLDRVSLLVALNAFATALAIVLGEVALFRWAGNRSALLAIGSVVIALSALLAGRFLLSTFNDARARMREQAARGRMSKQLGHDLRNPLGAIKGAAQFLEAEVGAHTLDDETAKRYLDIIVTNTDRVTRLIARYEHLARMEPELRDTEINSLVEGALDFLKGDSSVKVSKSLALDLPRCMVDPDLLGVAIANIARNAREALEKGGHIRIVTRSVGELVAIEISDDGPGMTAATRENVFDDFYSTKAMGSGLGLPFVQRVIQAHRGSVRLDSTEGKGTTVTLEIPIGPAS